mgnify:CR=1 FL=1
MGLLAWPMSPEKTIRVVRPSWSICLLLRGVAGVGLALVALAYANQKVLAIGCDGDGGGIPTSGDESLDGAGGLAVLAGFDIELAQRFGRAVGKDIRLVDQEFGGLIAALASGKIDVITALLPKVDRLLIGGAMMFTFLKSQGLSVGRSLVEDDRLDMAREVLAAAKAKGVELVLPVDCIASTMHDGSAPGAPKKVEQLSDAEMGVDIGPESVKLFASKLRDARTVVWNGPMGIFEVEAFAAGTMGVAKAMSELKAQGAVTVVGGGDSVSAVQQSGLAERFSHLSTGGGASLEFLEGKALPGVAFLES